ncbi:hypothetical protein [Flavobacterium sp.]|uniref:hypothetical protein n=1 Tax=Flavobacterium sp. TaxID=239 RepID=UPI0037536862
MTLRTTLTVIKFSSIVFVSAAMVFAVKYYDSQSKNKKLKETIQIDKKTYTNDLKEIFNRYDAQLLKNKNLIQSSALKQGNKTIIDESNLKYGRDLNNSSELVTNTSFLRKIDSLKSSLRKQSDENKSLTNQIIALINKNKELQKQNSDNENIITVSKNLTATNVYANGIKIVSNNIIETKRFSNTEQIKVCFTLLENKAALKGNKDLYIQIVNPNNKIVSKNGKFVEAEDKLLHFSAKTNIFYDNDELDVCVFVDPNKNDMLKGDYEINIFSGINLIGNTVFSLK